MKTLYIRHFHIWTLCSLLLCASSIFANAAPNSGFVHGLWVWKTAEVFSAMHGTDKLRDFCKSANIDEVYVSYSAKTAAEEASDFVRLISLLHRSNIHVEALLSSADADEPGKYRDKLIAEANEIVEFNRKHPMSQFDGIHLDVEPQQRPENKGEGNLKFLPGLADAFRAVRAVAEPARLQVNADIQNKLLKGDLAQRRMLLSAVPRVTLMMYEVTSPADELSPEQKAEKTVKKSQEFLDMAYDGLGGRNVARMAIALRTPDYGALLPEMLSKLDEKNRSNPHYLGWARHSYNDTLQASK